MPFCRFCHVLAHITSSGPHHAKKSLGICRQQRPRSAYASMQFVQDLHCLLTESLTKARMIYCVCTDDLNLVILCIFESMFAL